MERKLKQTLVLSLEKEPTVNTDNRGRHFEVRILWIISLDLVQTADEREHQISTGRVTGYDDLLRLKADQLGDRHLVLRVHQVHVNVEYVLRRFRERLTKDVIN